VRWLGSYSTCGYTFRATGTTYLQNGRSWSTPRLSPITNRLERPSYTNRTREELSFGEVERVNI
jgi:hypothetical protein